MMTAPRVVGCDVSLTSLGIATRHHAAVLTSTGHRGDTLTQRRERLGCLRRSVLDWTHHADLVVIEAPSYGSKGGSAHDRAGLWWLIVSALIHRGIPVVAVAVRPQMIGATFSGLVAQKRLVFVTYTVNTDRDGRNARKPLPRYRWVGVAAQDGAA